ncbi:EAL domain-containing protein [Bordetella hinzii]|uniref:cyclic-guanylate-specific phosphodiesterase n=1 Tax=Bordetella hinzii TaxID=103855 RepID=A0AAN1RWF3_9BORD|nr:cyclic diguanylate phosphodiesterase [Bordetella hinzii]AKQ62293.1 Putative cyclic-di-GMP phosphodiesterase AdrB [Bordetella hinzii]AZW16808.1 cyclic diguanylate phosphodiesterase [Bordetella hinzii]MBZ0075209.1 cyclic diguanylate phosphodiesterase [Bordetella hinzii]MBZ0079131.1 cyclic diguanylate phosphodiesterase [Bordetella hinzii]MBZ0085441.1 cyclic diguanylate phosphodiesterase [Bordetella hinzii]
MQAIKHRHRWSLLAALIAMALPPLLMAPLIWWMAQDRAKGESAITAATIQRQVDSTLDVVFDNVHHAVGLLDQPCPDAAPELARQANITLYYRSLSLMKHGRLYCTSLIGGVNFAPRDVFDGMPTLPAARAITPIAGSLVVPDRSAIVVSESTGPGTGAMAVIDGQYLMDIQKAASNNGEFRVQVDMSDTGGPLSPSVPAEGAAAFSTRASVQARSSRYPVVVTVAPALAAVAAHRRYLWWHHAPFLVIASLIAGYAAYRYNRRRLSLASEILRGMRQGEFSMVYQPVVHLPSGRMSGVEALIRWRRADLGMVRPDLFIPLAEQHGLMPALTRHIFGLVAADLPLLGLGPQDHLGINISGSHLAMPAFAQDVGVLMAALGPGRPKVVLELTEREALPQDPQTQANIRQARNLGVLWALDDFGTGQSALSYLRELDADFIKIDRSFVVGIGTDSVNAAVLETIISLGRRLHLDLTAEGIETEEQAEHLARHGVQWGQGYLYSPPLPPEALVDWRRAQG